VRPRKIRIENDLFHFCPGWCQPHYIEARSRETAEKRARELEDLGWFEVQIAEVDGSNEVTSRMVYSESA
jgi:hypothetical protein